MMTLRGGTISCVRSATSAKYPSPGAASDKHHACLSYVVVPCFFRLLTLASLPPKSDQQDFVRYSLACEQFLRSTWHGERRIPPRCQARNAGCLSAHANQRRSDRHPTLLRSR